MSGMSARQVRGYALFFAIVTGMWLLLGVTVYDESFGMKALFVGLGFGAFATGVAFWQTERRRPGRRRQASRES